MLRSPDRRALAALLAIQLAITLVVRPRGEFPVNDDWAFAHSVGWLLDEGRVRLSDWIAMNLLPQTLAGGLVAAARGFSFETLRHLTQAVAVISSLVAYHWFRANRLEPGPALVATLAVIAFPAWPQLANAYMSDLYGFAFALPAATLFLRALDEPARGRLIAATLLAAAGVLQRQVVLVVPFAFAAAWLWGRRPWTVRVVAIGLAPLAVACLAELAYRTYLAAGPGIPLAQQDTHARVLPMLVKALLGESGFRAHVGANALSITGYLGWFLVAWAAYWGMGGAPRGARFAVVVAGAALAATLLAVGAVPPYLSWQLVDAAGIGPYSLYDGIPRGMDGLDRSPGVLWRLAGVASAFGVAALVALLVATIRHALRFGKTAQRERVFHAAVLVGYLGPFVTTAYIDRYLLYTLPFLFALWSSTWTREPRPVVRGAALAWIAATLALSAAGTRDYFAWNRERWDLIRSAESRGITADQLDGGFEYNGWRRHEIQPRGVGPGKSWWWVKDDEYAIAFTVPPGYEEVDRRRVRRWLPRSPDTVRLVRRKP